MKLVLFESAGHHEPVPGLMTERGIVSLAPAVERQHTPQLTMQWIIDHFDRLYEEGEKSARVMAISVHPYISGVPHRIGYLEKLVDYIRQRPGVALWTGEQILDWYLGKS